MENVARPGEWMREHLRRVETANGETLETVARAMVRVVRADGLIYAAGTGHSTALLLETFYRAGGLACVRPVFHPALLPLAGAGVSTALERVPGFGTLLVQQAAPSQADLAVVFSNSGVNPVPVEMAEQFRAAGTPVVAVVSREHMQRAPARHARKLDAAADYLLDTLAPYGDAAYDAGAGTRTMPLSSLAGVYLWNLLLGRLAGLAAAEGIRLPLWTSANVDGGEARNRELLDRYRKRIPTL